MRALRLAVLPLLVATSLAAQAPPASSGAAAPPAAVVPARTAFFDVAALVDNRQRFGLEPLIFGRWAIGLIGTHYRTAAPQQVIVYGPIVNPMPAGLCPVTGCPPTPYPGNSSSYSAWSLDLAVRYYPAALSFNDPRRRFMVYLGEFIGYHQRTVTRTNYPIPLAGTPRTVADSGIPMPPPGAYYPYPASDQERLTGWEPGAEIGMRLIPLAPVFVDVGGWFKLVTIDDPTQRNRPGQVDARLVVAIGIGW
jgi:hypothetical protein